jgi:hypothetical protein
VAEDSWIALPGAPLGTTSFRYDKGSWLVYDGAQTILAHKSKYHELFGFDIMTDSWMIKHYSGMPYVGSSGRSKKSKDGGSATWLGDAVYALKGGNTQEFWQYRPSRDSWRERDSLPSVGSTGKKKKVKAGGDLAAVITGTIYGLKGNKTYEFWQYLKPGLASDAAPEAREGVLAAEAGRPAPAAGYVFPNPVRAGRSTIKLRGLTAGWAKGPVRLSLLDASGRLLRSGVTGPDSEVELALPAGVYVVRLAGAGTTCTRKLVVQR